VNGSFGKFGFLGISQLSRPPWTVTRTFFFRKTRWSVNIKKFLVMQQPKKFTSSWSLKLRLCYSSTNKLAFNFRGESTSRLFYQYSRTTGRLILYGRSNNLLIYCLEQYLTRMWDVNRKRAILNTGMEAASSFIITTVVEPSKMAPFCVVWSRLGFVSLLWIVLWQMLCRWWCFSMKETSWK
jgi:hypothetical protein